MLYGYMDILFTNVVLFRTWSVRSQYLVFFAYTSIYHPFLLSHNTINPPWSLIYVYIYKKLYLSSIVSNILLVSLFSWKTPSL